MLTPKEKYRKKASFSIYYLHFLETLGSPLAIRPSLFPFTFYYSFIRILEKHWDQLPDFTMSTSTIILFYILKTLKHFCYF